MPFFTYISSDKDGKVLSGDMEATSRETVIDYLKDQGFLPISVKEKSREVLSFSMGSKVTNLDKINLTGNLAIMLKAGVSMPEAIDVISKDSKNIYFKRIMSDVRFGLENGKSLSEGLENFKKDFDDVFINLIKAGEVSGKLQEVLLEINKQLKKDYALNSKIKSAFAYPVVLIAGLIAVVILLMIFVLPRLVTIFESSNLRLPVATRMIFSFSKILSAKPVVTIVVIVLLIIVFLVLIRKKKVRSFFTEIMVRIPVASILIKQMELVRFSRTLGNLLKSGISIIKALEITSGSLTLKRFKKLALDAKEDISKGVSISNAFRKDERFFPGLLISIIQVGEKTGELDALLFNLADFYEDQVDNTLRALTSLIEPVLLVFVGLAIGGMALSIILPIYQLIGSL